MADPSADNANAAPCNPALDDVSLLSDDASYLFGETFIDGDLPPVDGIPTADQNVLDVAAGEASDLLQDAESSNFKEYHQHHHHHHKKSELRRHSKKKRYDDALADVLGNGLDADDADLHAEDNVSDEVSAPAPAHVALSYPVANAAFSEDDMHLKFSVSYLQLDSEAARKCMCRLETEEAYFAAVDKTYEMPLFPPQLKEGGKYKDEYIQCSKFVMSTRIRRLLLENELHTMIERNQQFVDLMTLCVSKKAAHRERLLMLEKEMEHLAEDKQGVMSSPGSRFGALLTVKTGWGIIAEFLMRECKRLQLPANDNKAVDLAAEEFHESMSLDSVLQIWDLLQLWQLFHSVHYRSMSGGRSYPIPAKKLENQITQRIESIDDDSASLQEDKGKAQKEKDASHPPIDSVMRGQAAAHAASADEVLDSGSLQDALSLDNSSIASRPSIAKDTEALPDLEVASHASAASREANVTSKNHLHAASSAKSKVSDHSHGSHVSRQVEKKSGGGWGFNFNLFGSKQEEKVEIVSLTTVVKLEPLIRGFGLGEWSEVCEALGCQHGDISLLAAATAVLQKIGEGATDEKHVLHGLIPLVLRSDLKHSLEGMITMQEVNPALYISTKLIIDAIADKLEFLLIDSLRLYPNWPKTLESFRKDRVRKTGGKIDHNQDGAVEVDKQGTVRIIPNADQIIDTDILHGSRQRIQVSAAMPELQKRIGSAKLEQDKIRGELACVVQFGYSLVAPLVQRAIRGTLARMRKIIARRDLVLYAMHSAAYTLQGYIRARQGKRSFATAKAAVIGDLRTDMCLILQRNLRMFPKWYNHKKYVKQKIYDSWWFALTSFQALIRGFNARRSVRKLKNMHKVARDVEEKVWNVELLQKVARGYIARKTIVRSLKVRKSISRRVLLLAEKYLQGGDLWGFLKEIDDEFTRLGKEIASTAQREDELAHTFIQQVLDKRQGEFDGAWDRFSRLVTAQPNRRGGNDGDATGDNLSALSSVSVVKATWGPAAAANSSVQKSETGGMNDETAIPGPFLRRAVSATVQEGVQREVQRQKEGQSRGVTLAQEIQVAYGDDGNDGGVNAVVNKKGKTKTVKGKGKNAGQTLTSSSLSSLPSSQVRTGGSALSVATAPTGQSRKEIEDMLRAKKRSKKGQGHSNMQATTADFMSQAIASSTTGFVERNEQPSTGWSLQKACQGESFLLDIPKGINDTMERLLRAAAIRCFVPEFFSGHDVASAYKMYLILPHGLAKMRYEQEAYLYCQPAVSALRVKGVNKIKDAMPPKRVKQFLVSVNTPPKLMNLAMDFLYTLIKMGDIPSGIVHNPTMQRHTDFAEGKGTLQQVLNVSSPSKQLASKQIEGSQTVDATSVSNGANDSNSINSDVASTSLKSASAKKIRSKSIKIEASAEEEIPGVDPTLPNRLLVDMVERGQWSSMQAAADELLMHAAFLIVPFVQKVKMPDGGIQEIPTEYGHAAFRAHTRALQNAISEEEKRELVRERFRAALMLTTPYTLRLKADGTLSVFDLLERPDLKSLGMPLVLLEQVEALLSTAVSLSVSSKVVPTVRDHLSTTKEIFTVPMIFDPKFQRGPFDPYGRAPRIMPKLRMKKTKPDMPGGGNKDSENMTHLADDDIGDTSLWGKATKKVQSTLSTQQAKKLWGFQSDLPKRKGKGDDVEDSVGGVEENPQTDAPNLPVIHGKEAHSGNGNGSFPPTSATLSRSKKEMHERAKLLNHDFEAKVRSGFERPYACSHAGCDQTFSRAYSLKIHEKSHELFGNYHKFRNEAQLFLDPDKKMAEAEARAAFDARTLLPPLVQEEIYQLRVAAQIRAFDLAFDEQPPRIEVAVSRPPTAGQLFPELAWPSPEAPAVQALRDITSRQREFSPPSSPWKLPTGGVGTPMSISREGTPLSTSRSLYSRGGSRGGSHGGIGTITAWEDLLFPSSRGGNTVKFAFSLEETDEEFTLQAPLRMGISMLPSTGEMMDKTKMPRFYEELV